MRIKGYDIYGLQDKSFQQDKGLNVGRDPEQERPQLDPEVVRSFQQRLSQSKDLISNSEKEYFKELFPDSSRQIDSHVVFNSRGGLQANNVRKGVILDTVV